MNVKMYSQNICPKKLWVILVKICFLSLETAYLMKTLNPEILENSSGRVGVVKMSGSGRVAGTRQCLPMTDFQHKTGKLASVLLN